MNKPIEVIYSQQASDFIPGRAYANPRFFSTPRENVSKVFIVGDWPNIRAAYEARGIPVERLDEPPVAEPPPAARPPASLRPTVHEDERAAIYIPEDWRDLPWTRPAKDRDLTLRGLAAMFCDAPVLNKAQAVEAIEGELRRRDGAGE